MKGLAAVGICIALAGSVEAAEFLYVPQEAKAGAAAPKSPAEGILVREIGIVRGDTLWGISKKSGKPGMYYPQILLFNDIRNPDLIREGATLRVPVSASRHEERKKTYPKPVGRKPQKKKDPEAAKPRSAEPVSAQRRDRALYDEGMNDFRSGRYRQAERAFSRLLEKFPNSPYAPEAALQRAESLLRLSGM